MKVLPEIQSAFAGRGRTRSGHAGTAPTGLSEEDRRRLADIKISAAEALARGAAIDTALTETAESLRVLADARCCAISVLDEEAKHFASVHGSALPVGYAPSVEQQEIQLGASPCTAAVCLGQPVVAEDLEHNPLYRWFQGVVAPYGIRSCCSHPILNNSGRAVGTIALLDSRPREPSDRWLHLLESLSPIIHLVIEHHRRAAALESADVRFASLADSIPGVVYQRVVSPDGDIRYTYISDGAKDLFGVPAEEIIANPNALFDCHSPEYSATFRERLLQASRDLTMWDVEASIISRDGKHKWTHAIARPHRRADGAIVWDGVIMDSTRIKQAHLELAASNRSKSQFLANMSHELRTPLNAIIGFTEVMRDGVLGDLGNELYQEYIRDIHESGVRLLEIINDILDLAKIEAGALHLTETAVDVARLIDLCVKLLLPRAREHGIAVEVRAAPDLPPLWADERKLKQILNNLLSNAIKFSLDGGQILVAAQLSEAGDLSLTVADNGIGIPSDQLDRVFEPFAQVDDGLNRSFEGAGLGLALTKAMVELHGGTISLRSRSDIGTTVTVVLPKDRIRADPAPSAPHT